MGTCDRCGADAKVQIKLPSGGTLAFCAHHFNESHDALALAGALTVTPADEAWLFEAGVLA